MTYGIVASKSCLLTQISQWLQENTKKRYTVDRLSDHLAGGIPKKALTDYLRYVRRMVPSEPVIHIDDSDVIKPEGYHFESLGIVRDGSRSTPEKSVFCKGYHVIRDFNFNPRSPWGERRAGAADVRLVRLISIHAPRGGSDMCRTRWDTGHRYFNPRSLWGGATWAKQQIWYSVIKFQSTLPVGGATSHCSTARRTCTYFNPRSPWGERLRASLMGGTRSFISIHAPRGGSDKKSYGRERKQYISIHAPRRGSDEPQRSQPSSRSYFNPRSPWGERRICYVLWRYPMAFQSTLPVGGATPMYGSWATLPRFQSTLPVGGATRNFNARRADIAVSIHAPRGGSDFLQQRRLPF